MEKGEGNVSPEEGALLELPMDLIHDFEEKAYPIPKSDPHKMVAFLLEQRGLTPKDLWPVIGSKSRVSEILAGKRSPTKQQARNSPCSSLSRWNSLFERQELPYRGRMPMPRYAFKLRIKSGAIEEYEREHQRVWPELLAKLKDVGISDYSIFRRGQDLVLVLRVDDFEKAWDELDRDPVNQRWQVFMSGLFEPVPDKQEGERFAMLKEVFYLE